MSSDAERIRREVAALVENATAGGTPADVVGRLLIQAAIALWQRERDWSDIARELQSVAENLDPDADHEFMRP